MKFCAFACIAFVAILGSGSCFTLKSNTTDDRSKIIGGEKVKIETAPYQVYLKYRGRLWCSGVLISLQHVLTAAHCVREVKEQNVQMSIVAGTEKSNVPQQSTFKSNFYEVMVESIIIHPGYIEKSPFPYDIALLRLITRLPKDSPRVATLPLPKRNLAEHDILTITGIGSDGTHILSPYLKTYKARVVNCAKYQERAFLHPEPSVFCHWDNSGVKTGAGDSGSPITNSRGELVGIHSSSFLQIQTAANVYFVLPFIRKNMK